MNRSKKFIAALLCLLLTFTAISGISVFAAEKTVTVTSSLSKSTVLPGETVTQTIGFSDPMLVEEGIRGFKLVIAYDGTKLVNAQVVPLGEIQSAELTVSKQENKLVILYLDSDGGNSPAPADQPAVKVTYTVADSASGTVDLTVSSGSTANFIDCSYKDSDSAGEVVLRNVAPIFPQTQSIGIGNPLFVTTYSLHGDMIAGIDLGTNVHSFLANFTVSDGVSLAVQNSSGASVEDNSAVVTGMKLCVYQGESLSEAYTIAVKGDLFGNGSIDIRSLVRLKKYNADAAQLNPVQLLAADMDDSSVIDADDLAQMKKLILGIR